MFEHTKYERLLEEKREIDNHIHEFMGNIDVFPDVYEEYGIGIDEWSPRNENYVLRACKIESKIGKLEARRRKISRKLGALKNGNALFQGQMVTYREKNLQRCVTFEAFLL